MSHINAYGLSSADYAKLYGVWRNIISRCYDERSERFYTYGERGITVCESWKTDFHAYARWALENGWEPGLSIERKDVDGMYCPENCTFITMVEQMRNKTNNVRITIDGKEKCLVEWCEIFHVPFGTAWARYKVYGLTTPDLVFFPGDLRELRHKITQLTLDGKVIGEYVRLKDAARSAGADPNSIRSACQGRNKTAGGYRWKYAQEAR